MSSCIDQSMGLVARDNGRTNVTVNQISAINKLVDCSTNAVQSVANSSAQWAQVTHTRQTSIDLSFIGQFYLYFPLGSISSTPIFDEVGGDPIVEITGAQNDQIVFLKSGVFRFTLSIDTQLTNSPGPANAFYALSTSAATSTTPQVAVELYVGLSTSTNITLIYNVNEGDIYQLYVMYSTQNDIQMSIESISLSIQEL